MKNILLIILLFFSSIGESQNLVNQDWVNFLCNNSYIQSAKSISIDKDQNIYILGRFPNYTSCSNQDFYEEDGVFLLFKLNPNGDNLWVKSIGSAFNFSSGGDIEINSNGDLILGFPFRGDFMLNQETICSSNESSSIILKLDSEGDLKWFNTYDAKVISYVQDLHLDKNDNIYATISFFDSLKIDSEYLFQEHYGSCILKLNSNGELDWYHQIHADNTIKIKELDFMEKDEKKLLVISGQLTGDSVFINNECIGGKTGKFNNQNFIVTINESGEINGFKMLDSNIRTISSITNFNEKIYLSGIFTDTVSWLEYETIAKQPYIPFICELNINKEITYFKDLFTSSDVYISDLILSNEYGFLMAGDFKGEFKCSIDSITLENEYRIGSFITNFNEELNQEQIKFIKGGTFSIVDMELSKEQIVAIANYEQNCSFSNLDFHAWNNDFLVFETSEFDSLENFHPGNYLFPTIDEENFSDSLAVDFIQVYPNPFSNWVSIKGIKDEKVSVYNTSGMDITNKFIITKNENEMLLENKQVPSGIYFLSINGENTQIFKMVKINL